MMLLRNTTLASILRLMDTEPFYLVDVHVKPLKTILPLKSSGGRLGIQPGLPPFDGRGLEGWFSPETSNG